MENGANGQSRLGLSRGTYFPSAGLSFVFTCVLMVGLVAIRLTCG